jgi:hypothetical protein
MGFFDGKSHEEEAYEHGQDVGAHEGPGTQALHSLFSALMSDSEQAAWEAGFENGRKNRPKE